MIEKNTLERGGGGVGGGIWHSWKLEGDISFIIVSLGELNMSSNVQMGHLGNLLVNIEHVAATLVQFIPPMKGCWSGHISRTLSDGARYAAKKKGEYYALADEYHR